MAKILDSPSVNMLEVHEKGGFWIFVLKSCIYLWILFVLIFLFLSEEDSISDPTHGQVSN